MSNFWKKIFTPKKPDTHVVAQSYNEDIDAIFAQKFTASGGFFNYEASMSEGLSKLNEMILVLKPNHIFCLDKNLQKYLDQLGINYNQNYTPECDLALINCECLVAFDGSIMISSDNVKSLKINHLPSHIVIWSNPNQIVENKSEGLQYLRKNKKDKIPSNITSLLGKKSQSFLKKEYAKDLYLLLVENI